ncbi:hypothetical protein BO70DRAFT_378649 [Aspergillus heteromorphus CBS 117.55]|uniref:DUF1772-domain-containing protein n=1 Tax=Aspergillus heteromorphus CBS 117.55 TaxID=1448321 RepID=A0A317WHJ0_9EURO|nr:uncharacterized protein BO70DRAFT_378649 [Aspergillus heteromorphus CBS 117.55]PWY85954.1 hypothetical protein BO70DRAFT_378649 [Aspergillus heteromorphus CBS 117.55]
MSAFPTSFRIAQAVGLTSAAWLSGTIFSLSYITIPVLLQSHHDHAIPLQPITKQWRTLYETGKRRVPPLALLTASTFLYLAWRVRHNTPVEALASKHSMAVYVGSALLTLGIVPWTAVVMGGTNGELMAWAERGGDGVREEKGKGVEKDDKEEEEERVRGLLARWGWLNAGRAVWPLLGGVVSLMGGLV